MNLTAGTDVTVSLTGEEPDPEAAPTVNSVEVTSDPGADETYAIGDTIQVTVTFGAAVTVDTSGGTPRIQLRVGGGDPEHLKWADYSSGSGNEALVFSYTVQYGDTDGNGIYIEADELFLNGGTIQSAADRRRSRLPPTGHPIGPQGGHGGTDAIQGADLVGHVDGRGELCLYRIPIKRRSQLSERQNRHIPRR